MRRLKIEDKRAEIIRPEIQAAMNGRDDLNDIMFMLRHYLPSGIWVYKGGSHLAIHAQPPSEHNWADERLAIIY